MELPGLLADVVQLILNYCEIPVLLRFLSVSKTYRQLASSNHIWACRTAPLYWRTLEPVQVRTQPLLGKSPELRGLQVPSEYVLYKNWKLNPLKDSDIVVFISKLDEIYAACKANNSDQGAYSTAFTFDVYLIQHGLIDAVDMCTRLFHSFMLQEPPFSGKKCRQNTVPIRSLTSLSSTKLSNRFGRTHGAFFSHYYSISLCKAKRSLGSCKV